MNLILFIILIQTCSFSKIIIFPLKIQFPKCNYMSYGSYNSSDFIKENYKKNLRIEMTIGSPPQKIEAYVNPTSYCFEFKSSKLNSTSNYYPHESTTFKINQQQTTKNTFVQFIQSSDLFTFNKNESYTLSFVSLQKLNINLDNNISLIA